MTTVMALITPIQTGAMSLKVEMTDKIRLAPSMICLEAIIVVKAVIQINVLTMLAVMITTQFGIN